MAVLVWFIGGSFGMSLAGEAPGAAVSPPPLAHRPLRDNVERVLAEPTDPHPFTGYPSAPPFAVVPQKGSLTFYPCAICHDVLPANKVVRKLDTPHNSALVHGNGRFWCLDCHQLKNSNFLHTLNGQNVDFDDAYLVCGQCHFNRQKDWYFGAHGKRVANWKGDRVIYNCTHCHDPHDPTIKPRAPSRPPPVRVGLKPMVRAVPEPLPSAKYLRAPIQGSKP